MFSFLSGGIILGVSACTLWYFLPDRGKPHPLAKRALLDTVIPVCIVSGFGVGVALVVSALVELAS